MLKLHALFLRAAWPAALALLLAACGGGGGGGGSGGGMGTASTEAAASVPAALPATATAPAERPTTQLDAVRLAHQASFGPSPALVAEIKAQGAEAWLAAQLARSDSRYTSGGTAAVHQFDEQTTFCALPAHQHPDCWRNHFSTQPLVWDFYRNALGQPDQLRQRVAFALGQWLVVSGVGAEATYGFREYHNLLLGQAFGNYRELLRKVTLSPLMGDYLNHANNDAAAPNENYARELLELFSLGTCLLNADGTLAGGRCQPVFDNTMVRRYALALTGWTYPAGGRSGYGCWPRGANCRFYQGDMLPLPALHDRQALALLSGVSLAAGHDNETALNAVLDSVMRHPNLGPFIAQRFIQHLVTSNPTPAYVARVAQAFDAGRYQGATRSFGSGTRGDLAATVAAVLLDTEARTESPSRQAGKLREPVLLFTGVLRAVGGRSDGDALGWWWGGELSQVVFRAPSVFNFYSPHHPVPGTALKGPEFGLHNPNAALRRLNFMSFLLDQGGAGPDAGVPQATGTQVDLSALAARADDAQQLVDEFSLLVIGRTLPAATRSAIVQAVAWWTPQVDADQWRTQRARTAAYLVLATPQYQVQP